MHGLLAKIIIISQFHWFYIICNIYLEYIIYIWNASPRLQRNHVYWLKSRISGPKTASTLFHSNDSSKQAGVSHGGPKWSNTTLFVAHRIGWKIWHRIPILINCVMDVKNFDRRNINAITYISTIREYSASETCGLGKTCRLWMTSKRKWRTIKQLLQMSVPLFIYVVLNCECQYTGPCHRIYNYVKK